MQLRVTDLTVGYGDTPVVKELSFAVDAGEVVVIVGPNGCGKTTLLKSIARLIKPDAGSITLNEMDIWHEKPATVARQLALLPQQPIAPEGITVEELVRYGRHPHQGLFRQWSQEDRQQLEASLQATDLLDIKHSALDHLSGGQTQRAWLAMCLAQDTPLVLLDEPTAALDLGHQVEVLNLVKSLSGQGKSFLLVLHDLFSAARYADKLIAMVAGKIVAQGKPEDIVTPALVQELYGVDCDVLQAPGDNAPVIIPRLAQ